MTGPTLHRQNAGKRKASAVFLNVAKYIAIPAAIVFGGKVLYEGISSDEKFPAIAVAFNSQGKSFVATSSNTEKARKEATQECNDNTKGLDTSCLMTTYSEAGQKACIDYGAITIKRYTFKLEREGNRFKKHSNEIITSFDFAKVSNAAPLAGENPIKDLCLQRSPRNIFSAKDCNSVSFDTVCNFTNDLKTP